MPVHQVFHARFPRLAERVSAVPVKVMQNEEQAESSKNYIQNSLILQVVVLLVPRHTDSQGPQQRYPAADDSTELAQLDSHVNPMGGASHTAVAAFLTKVIFVSLL